MNSKLKKEKRDRRQKKIRSRVSGTSSRPRLSVYKSNRYVYLQLIDDQSGKTLAHSTSMNMKAKNLKDRAYEVGKDMAQKAKEKNIKKAVFDRGGYVYTGLVENAAKGARDGGLEF